MFGFIKYLQKLIEKLRKNKRVWFTTLFAISSIGITLSIVLFIMLTNSASKEVYVAQSSEYKLRHNNFTSNKLSEFRRLSSIALEDQTLSTAIEQDDIGAITQSVQSLNTALAQKGFNDYQITYYSARNSILNNIIASVIQTRNTSYGLHVFSDGVYYVYLEPIVLNGQTMGVFEVKSSTNNMYVNFLNLDQEFAFLLDKNMVTNIALDFREESYDEVADSFVFDAQMFNNQMMKELQNLKPKEFREFMDEGYFVTDAYYIAYDKIVDLNGVNIGLVVFGERTDKEGGFINVTTKITDQVIMVALGLIVSVLLFMF